MAHRRIDVHQHLVPRPYADWLHTRGIAEAGGRELPVWSADEALVETAHALDTRGASGGVLLANTHGTYLGAPEQEPLLEELARRETAALAAETGRSPFEILDDFAGFFFDTALSSSPAALPTLLAFAKPGHVLFGSDCPFAPEIAVSWFASSLDADPLHGLARAAIDRDAAAALFPNLS